MALDRWIALILLGICMAYGYAAWFTMDGALAPFMQRNPIWPSTFPKVLSILGMAASLIILLGLEKGEAKEGAFLILGSFILGERKWLVMVPVSATATLLVWYLVQEVLGIYMRPLPGFIGG